MIGGGNPWAIIPHQADSDDSDDACDDESEDEPEHEQHEEHVSNTKQSQPIVRSEMCHYPVALALHYLLM